MRPAISEGPEPDGKNFDAKLLADAICQSFSFLVENCENKFLQYRLEKAVSLAISNMSSPPRPISPLFYLSSFRFNEHYPLHEQLKAEFYIDWGSGNKITVHIPKIRPLQQLTTPPRAKKAILKIGAVNIQVYGNMITDRKFTEIDIPLEDIFMPAQKIVLPVNSQPYSISIVATGIRYIAEHNGDTYPVAGIRWQPAEILDAVHFLNSVQRNF